MEFAFAYDKEGRKLIASAMGPEAWDALKSSYQIGDFTMPCCKSPAIPKTSIRGYPFFAHYVDECTSAPETKWHLDAKEVLAFNLSNMHRSAGTGWLIFTSSSMAVELLLNFSTPTKR